MSETSGLGTKLKYIADPDVNFLVLEDVAYNRLKNFADTDYKDLGSVLSQAAVACGVLQHLIQRGYLKREELD